MSTQTATPPNFAGLSASVQPYLFFNGRCEEAIEFYRAALGARDVAAIRFKDSPVPPQPGTVPPGHGDKIMHASFWVGDTMIMASDGCVDGKLNFQGFSLSLTLKTSAEAARAFAALSEGGKVEMPLGKTFFSESFGMLVDRFGVGWMIHVAAQS
jgi:PhnB protein